MATLTIRNVPEKTVRALKKVAARNHRSMQQELLVMLESAIPPDRAAALAQLDKLIAKQKRRPTAKEVDGWIKASRP